MPRPPGRGWQLKRESCAGTREYECPVADVLVNGSCRQNGAQRAALRQANYKANYNVGSNE